MFSENRSDEGLSLRMDTGIFFPNFLPTLRTAVRKSESGFRNAVLKSGLPESAREAYLARSSSAFEEFDRRLGGAEMVRDSKKQSASVNSALLEFNSTMRKLRSEFASEIRSAGEGDSGAEGMRLRISDAESFLRENGM